MNISPNFLGLDASALDSVVPRFAEMANWVIGVAEYPCRPKNWYCIRNAVM